MRTSKRAGASAGIALLAIPAVALAVNPKAGRYFGTTKQDHAALQGTIDLKVASSRDRVVGVGATMTYGCGESVDDPSQTVLIGRQNESGLHAVSRPVSDDGKFKFSFAHDGGRVKGKGKFISRRVATGTIRWRKGTPGEPTYCDTKVATYRAEYRPPSR